MRQRPTGSVTPRTRARRGFPRVIGTLALSFALVAFLVWFWARSIDHPTKQSISLSSGSLGSSSQLHGPSGDQRAVVSVVAAPPRAPLHRPLWWFAPFLDHSSFGAEASVLVTSLLGAGVLPASQLRVGLLQNSCKDEVGSVMDQDTHSKIVALHRPVSMTDRSASIVVCHNMPLYYGRPGAAWAACERCPPSNAPVGYAIARAMSETDRITPDFTKAINSMDEVWVPSNFSAEALSRSGVQRNKLRVVPLVVNVTFWSPAQHQPLQLPRGTQVFGSLANGTHVDAEQRHVGSDSSRSSSRRRHASGKQHMGGRGSKSNDSSKRQNSSAKVMTTPFRFVSVFKWEQRKGWDVLLKAYLQEFSSADHVELYVLTSPFLEQNFMTTMRTWVDKQLEGWQASSLPKLFVIPDHLPLSEYGGLLAAVDAFVLPTRGEGWGLPIMEAMSMGLPVIATGWSGPAAYLDDSVGYPLQYRLAEVPDTPDMPGWFKGSMWAEPDSDHLCKLMRYVTDHRAEAKARGGAARERVLERYSPTVVAGLIHDELLRIEAKIGSR